MKKLLKRVRDFWVKLNVPVEKTVRRRTGSSLFVKGQFVTTLEGEFEGKALEITAVSPPFISAMVVSVGIFYGCSYPFKVVDLIHVSNEYAEALMPECRLRAQKNK